MIRRFLFIIFYILCFVLTSYGISVQNLNSGSSFYLIWYFLAVMSFLLGIKIKKDIFSKLPKFINILLIIVISIGIIIFIFTESLVISRFNEKTKEDLDYLIILGSQIRKDGPSTTLYFRLEAALDYLKDHPNTTIVVSGGQGKNEPISEALGMKEYLVKKGVDEKRIIMEDQSRNTTGNIQNSMKLIDYNKKVGIVTNNFHLYRAMSIAKKQGIKNIYGISAYSTPYYYANNCLREFFGIVKDKMLHNL